MSDQPRLGVLGNGRTLARLYSNVFTTYQQELRSALDWFDQQELTVSSLENLCVRVRRVADALGDEADVLDRRSGLALTTTTGPAASALGSESGGARREPF